MAALRSPSRSRRARFLASDARAGSWARGRARVAQRQFAKEHWKLFGGATLALLALTSIVAALMPTGFMRGLVVGAFLVAGPAALWSWIVQVTGTAPPMMGDIAEQWTAGELRKLRTRGWHLVNHFVLAKDDIDHVLVGPSHAIVLETKWSATPWDAPVVFLAHHACELALKVKWLGADPEISVESAAFKKHDLSYIMRRITRERTGQIRTRLPLSSSVSLSRTYGP